MVSRGFLFVVLALGLLLPASAAAATDYRSAILEDDPTVYLRLGERTGTTAANIGRHGGHAEINGAPDLGVYGALESDPTSDRAIRLNDYTGDHLIVRPAPGSTVSGEYTAEAWVNLDAHLGRDFLFAGGADLYFETWYSTVFTGAVVYATPTPRRWVHVAVTATPTEVEYFLDGISQGSHPVASPPLLYNDARPLYVGWELLGQIDEVATYDRVLPASRIAEHHRIGVEGMGAPAPASVDPPTVSGSPSVGATITCDEGEWTNGPRDFTFRWLRDGQAIPLAADQRYSVSSDDRGHALSCGVVARNAAGASSEEASDTLAIPDGARATDYRSMILEDAPRFYLPLDERDPGPTYPNHGRDGGHAVINGDPVTGVYGAIEGDVDSDRALRLDGSDNLVLRPEAGSVVKDTFTVEGWVKQERHGGVQFLFNHGGEMRLDESSLFTPAGHFNGQLALKEWHHLVMTVRGRERYRAGEAELWVDGVSRGTLPLHLTGFWEWVYGDRDQTIGWQLIGWMDELAVYDYRLSPARIVEHHRRGRQGWAPPVPSPRTEPSVGGQPVVGATARCDEGDWTGGPREFAYRWLRDGQAIARADEQRYSLGAHDLNHEITCEIAATNITGTSSYVASTNAIAMPAAPARTSYHDLVMDDNPSTYLRLNEQPGAAAVTNIGSHGGDALISGNPQLGELGALESDPAGDTAMWFDGNDALTLRPEPGSVVRDTFTVEGWVKQDRHPLRWAFIFNHGGELRLDELGIHTPSGTYGGAMALNEWHHVAMAVRGRERDRAGEAEVFVDGVSRGTHELTLTGMWEVVYGDREQVIGHMLEGSLDELAIYDYRLTPERIAEHAGRGVSGFGAPPPVATTPPRPVVDVARAGRTATCQDDAWSGGPRTFAYRWLRSGAPIPRATRREYTLSADDLGHRITCAITASNIAGSSPQVVSEEFIAMPAAPAIATYHDVVSVDEPVVHLPFTSLEGGVTPNVGSHGGNAILRGDVVSSGGAIAESDDPGVHLDGNDHLELRPEPGSRVDGTWTAEGWVNIEGWPYWDPHLWASGAHIRIDDGALASHAGALGPGPRPHQWAHVVLTHRASTLRERGATEIYLDGRLLGTLGPGVGRVYDDAMVVIAGWHLLGALDELAIYDYRLTPERVNAHYRAGREGVDEPYPEAIAPPTVQGDVRAGSTITCDEGSWSGSPTSYEYRWTRDGTALDGATSAAYAITPADAGTRLSCEVRATNLRGTSSWSSASSAVLVPVPPRNISPPVVVGIAKPGERVTCASGAWNATGTTEVRWQLDGPDVPGVAPDRYDVIGPDGGRLRCLVRMTGTGGTSEWVASEAVVIDAVAPVVELTCPPGPITPGSPANATYTASDARSGLLSPPTGVVTLDTAAPGTFTARVSVRDLVGHTSEATCTYRVVHPRPGAPEPSRELTADGLLRLTWAPAAGSPSPARFELQGRSDGDASWTDLTATAARSFDVTTPLADGRWRFRVRAVDPAFDDAWSAESSYVVVDRTAPTASITCPTAPVVRTSAATASYTGADGGSGLATPASGTVTLDTATIGTKTARVTVRDRAGHATDATCTYRVVYHRPAAPQVIYGSNPSASGNIAIAWDTLSATEPNPARFELQVRDGNDAVWRVVSSPTARWHYYSTALAEGTSRFRVRAVDPSFEDTWSDLSVPVVVDRGAPYAPTLSADRAPDYSGAWGDWYLDRVTVSFADAGDRTLADGSPGSGVDPASVPATATYTTSGTHTASGTVLDRAGNRSASASLTARVDATAPSVTHGCPDADLSVGESDSAWFFASDAHSRLATPASGSIAADTSTPGTRQIVITARDNVGHTTTRTCSYTVKYPQAVFNGGLRTDRDNTVDAGTVVPIRFDLGGNFGLDVLEGTPTVVPVDCDNRSRDFNTTLPSATPPLRYDSTNDYRWAFVVDPAWRNTCRRVTLTLRDGTVGSWSFRIV